MRDREMETERVGGGGRECGRERGAEAGRRERARDEIETWKNLLPRKFHSAI